MPAQTQVARAEVFPAAHHTRDAKTGAVKTTPVTVAVVPGKSAVVAVPVEALPRVAIADWLPQGDGTYKPVARLHTKRIRLTMDLPKKLGLGIDYQTLLRLARGGFIVAEHPTPGTWIICLQSYFDHVKRVQEEPEFWEQPANLRRYLQAI